MTAGEQITPRGRREGAGLHQHSRVSPGTCLGDLCRELKKKPKQHKPTPQKTRNTNQTTPPPTPTLPSPNFQKDQANVSVDLSQNAPSFSAGRHLVVLKWIGTMCFRLGLPVQWENLPIRRAQATTPPFQVRSPPTPARSAVPSSLLQLHVSGRFFSPIPTQAHPRTVKSLSAAVFLGWVPRAVGVNALHSLYLPVWWVLCNPGREIKLSNVL